MHSTDLYMVSMLHTTFQSVSQLQHDAVLSDIVGHGYSAVRRDCSRSGADKQCAHCTSRWYLLLVMTSQFHVLQTRKCRHMTRRVYWQHMQDPFCNTGLSHGACHGKHAVRLVTNINIISKTERVWHTERGVEGGGEGIRSSGEETARSAV